MQLSILIKIMNKLRRKILPVFVLTAIILIAGGFSDGAAAQAKMIAMNDSANASNQIMHFVDKAVSLNGNLPVSNSLRPCCENRQGGTSAIQSSVFDQGVKLSATDFSDTVSNNDYSFNQKIIGYSSASPPKPDVLSSILKKE